MCCCIMPWRSQLLQSLCILPNDPAPASAPLTDGYWPKASLAGCVLIPGVEYVSVFVNDLIHETQLPRFCAMCKHIYIRREEWKVMLT